MLVCIQVYVLTYLKKSNLRPICLYDYYNKIITNTHKYYMGLLQNYIYPRCTLNTIKWSKSKF